MGGCLYTSNADGTIATRDSVYEGIPCPRLRIRWTAEGNFPMRIRVGSAPDTTVYTFLEDPAGRLARMDKNGAVYRYFLWNGDDLYAELDSTGAMLTEYSWYPGLDRLYQFKDGATGFNAGTDAMGNVVVLTTSTCVYRTYETGRRATAW